jgi:transcriptional regulator with XRE-family HTH domain
VTPEELRTWSAAEEALSADAKRRGDFAAALRHLERAAYLSRHAAHEQHGPTTRPVPMAAIKARLSRMHRGPEPPAMEAARAAGYVSLRELARALKIDATYLSRIVHGKRPAPPRIAEEIERLTGYPASSWKR